MKVTRFRCVVCEKLTAGRMPRHDNGAAADTTARYPRKHLDEHGRDCRGAWMLAEWVDVEIGE